MVNIITIYGNSMEEVYLRELSLNDGEKELEFMRNLPKKERGFENPSDPDDLINIETFKEWLGKKSNEAKGLDLKEGYVPQTIYWIMLGNEVVGIGKLRHYLNDHLLQHGGNIGYGVSNEYRGKGIATKALALILKEAEKYDQDEVLLTTDEDNVGSRKVIENNNGVLKKIENGSCYYWIKIKDKQPKTV